MDNRLSWWIGKGLSIEAALNQAKDMELPKNLINRIELITTPKLSTNIRKQHNILLKELFFLQKR